MPQNGGDAASFRQCLKGTEDGQAADGVACLPAQAKGPEQLLGMAAHQRRRDQDAHRSALCKPLKYQAAALGGFLLNRAAHVQIHAESVPQTAPRSSRSRRMPQGGSA